MPSRSSKNKSEPRKRAGTSRDHDFVTVARSVVERAIGEKLDGSPLAADDKNPHAVALGRLGGAKGGKARAQALSAKRRSDIAKAAARKRWKQT